MSLQPGPDDNSANFVNPTQELGEGSPTSSPPKAEGNATLAQPLESPNSAETLVVPLDAAHGDQRATYAYAAAPAPAASSPGPSTEAPGISASPLAASPPAASPFGAPPLGPPLLPPPAPAWSPTAPQSVPYPGNQSGPVRGSEPPGVPPGGAIPPLGSQMGYPSAQAGYPGYPGTMAARQTDSKAVVALVLAIGSWVVCPVILAIISLILASQSNRDIDASGGILDGKALNTASKVISWANIAVSVLAIIAAVVVLIVIPIAIFVLSLFGAALGGVSVTELVPTPTESGF